MSRCRKFSLFFLLCLTGLLQNSFSAFSQDRIIKTNNDTIMSTVIEMTSNKIRFRRYGMKNGPILEIYKNQVSKILYENGSELEIIYDIYYVDPEMMIHVPKNVVKIDFLSPLFNQFTFGYERAIRLGVNLDVKAGIIGFRISEGLEYAEGFLVKAGVKFIWTTESILRGLTYKHPMNGKYLKPELIYNQFDTFGEKGKITYNNYAFCVNFGNQYILWNRFTLDYYAGLGYAYQKSNYDATSSYDRNDVELNYNHSHFYFGKKFPLALNGGLTAGMVF